MLLVKLNIREAKKMNYTCKLCFLTLYAETNPCKSLTKIQVNMKPLENIITVHVRYILYILHHARSLYTV